MKQNTAADKISGFESSCVALGEMRQIVEKFNAAADAYYNDRSELMTDFEWNALFDRLKVLEAESGVVLSDTPTVNVFADDVAGQKRDGLGQRLRQDELPHQQRRQLDLRQEQEGEGTQHPDHFGRPLLRAVLPVRRKKTQQGLEGKSS